MPELGFGTAPISPPSGVRMGGYAGRTARATGIHDPLTATALAIRDRNQQAAIVSIDAVIVSAALKERAAAAIGLGAGSLLLAASHTHSGPGGDQLDLLLSRAYYDLETMDALVAAIRQAYEAASAALRPGRVAIGTGTIRGIASDRVLGRPSAPAPGALIRCTDDRGRLLGVIANYACHPTVLDERNTQLSADYVAGLRSRLQDRTGAPHILFLNGACGDLSTRFSRRAATHAEAERLGALVADELCGLEAGGGDGHLHTELGTVRLANRGLDSAPGPAGDPRAEAAAAYARSAEELLRHIDGLGYSDLPVQLIGLGPVRILGLSVELFHRLRPPPSVVLACYANAHHGYAVAPDTPPGAYERLSTLLPDTAGARLISYAGELLNAFS
ncbi:MAG TPA: neutral/alkaline non-lysosomal ceramidase N-terminal domain-containing protein [Mycobacteriales bacterium]|nr:neutral/alkaline non-lysosomal ceramidase N-terminal domain-containing protein [Mycobacteriales bacterium]